MAIYISYRNVSFSQGQTSVTITVETDVASTLTLRLTNRQPWIHKKTSFIRGLTLKEDIRFCFTVYQDYEQSETEDTFIHTWVIDGWLPGDTKWFYFFGSVDGQLSPSTSPIFQFSNTWTAPPPVSEIMAHPTIKTGIPPGAHRTVVTAQVVKIEVT